MTENNNTIKSITDTIEGVLDKHENLLAGYTSIVENIKDELVAALDERDFQITDVVVEGVSSQFDVDADVVRDYAEDAGLSIRPEPEVEEDEDDVEDENAVPESVASIQDEATRESLVAVFDNLNRMTGILDRLVSVAERNGLSV